MLLTLISFIVSAPCSSSHQKGKSPPPLSHFLQLALIAFAPCALASPCERSFKPREFSSPEAFALAMTRNLELSRGQESLFEFYRKGWLSKPETYIENRTLTSVFDFLEQNPGLSKPLVRERQLIFTVQKSPKPDSLVQFERRFKTASRIRGSLYQISANEGFWEKALFDDLKYPRAKKSFTLDRFINKETREFVEDPFNDYKTKAFVLYQALNKIRKDWLKSQRSAKRLSQIMVNLVHTAGWGNSYYNGLLKSGNPADNMEGILKILAEREFLSVDLGFESFDDLHQTLTAKRPESLKAEIEKIKKDIENQPISKIQTEVFRLRSLSIQEAPFRSCLSGDCASQIYFHKALDPGFLYWTLTDNQHKSSGYAAVVLGHAKNQSGKSEKIGFVDKIQNIPPKKLAAVLEGIRQSLAELGYKLGLPKKLGGHNGISNSLSIRNHIKMEILPHLTTEFNFFEPEPDKGLFQNPGFSRAEDKLDLMEFEPGKINDLGAKIKKGRIYPPEKADPLLSAKSLYKQSFFLLGASKNEENQIRFLNQLLPAKSSKGLALSDKYVGETLLTAMRNSQLSFKARKLALMILIQFEVEKDNELFLSDLEGWLSFFSKKERQMIIGEISNWKKSNASFKKAFIQDVSQALFISDINKLKALFESKYKAILDIEVEDDLGFSPLDKAAQNGWGAIAALLIKNGADPNKKRTIFSYTPLMLAIRNKQISSAEALVKGGADINAKTSAGWTALMISAWNKDKEEMAWLIENGADPHAENRLGQTALALSWEKGDIKAIQLLRENGARLNAKNAARP